jgi:hypothetical protein
MPNLEASPLFQLPPDIADFIGRGQVTAELMARLTDEPAGNAVIVCAVSGKGGVSRASSPVLRTLSLGETGHQMTRTTRAV